MPFTIFQRAAHRIPVLALYKSLLKLSSSPSLDQELAKRVHERVRQRFRQEKLWSPRKTKANLIKAFTIHANLERAINGDQASLKSLYRSFPPPKHPLPPIPPPELPSPPQFEPKPINVYAAPTIRYPQLQLPIMVYPTRRQSHAQSLIFTYKMRMIRKYSLVQGSLSLMIYHAQAEEQFLQQLAVTAQQDWKYEKEAGLRELLAMQRDMSLFLAEIALEEDILVENELKEWVRLHPNAKFRPIGMRMPRAKRKLIESWRTNVRRIKRDHVRLRQRVKFMKSWQTRWAKNSDFTEYKHPQQNRLKRLGKSLRRKKMGKYFL